MSPKKSKLITPKKRFFKLAGMTASVAGRYTRTRMKGVFSSDADKEQDLSDMYRELGWQIVSTLGELKGAAMKVGQAVSQMQHLFPAEFADELAKLQKSAAPMPFEVIEQQLRSELGLPVEKLFEKFDREPFAAASIGQVHRARTWDGKEVVVKIQYPGVDVSCASDMKHLKRLLQLGGLVKVDKKALDKVFDEIQTSLMRELDYQQEAENLLEFHELHKQDEGIVIPLVIENFSSRRVLTLSYEPGDDLKQLKSPRYSQETINLIGHRLFDAIGQQIFQFKAVHSDPHPGNFAFRPDGTLIIYDFGSVTRLSDKLLADYREVITAAIEEDYRRLDSALISLGVRVADGPAVDDAFYKLWLDIFLKPLKSGESFNYGLSTLHEEIRKNRAEIFRYWGAFQPSADTLFVNRVIGGHYLTMAEMGVEANFGDALLKFLHGQNVKGARR